MIFELIKREDNCPFTAKIFDAQDRESHFHNYLEILFLLSGSLTFKTLDHSYKLTEHDFVFANSNQNHSILNCSPDCRIMKLKIHIFSFQNLFLQ